MGEVDKILNEYISHHIKKVDFNFVKQTFELKFNNNFIQRIEINYCYNTDNSTMKSYLLNWIEYYKLGGYNFYNNRELVIETLNHKCNMTYEHYMHQPMHIGERYVNMIIARKRQLINSFGRNKNHLFFQKISYTIY